MTFVSDKEDRGKPKVKISLINPICATLVALGPYLWLLVGIKEAAPQLMLKAIISPLLFIAATWLWIWTLRSRTKDSDKD